MRGFASGGWPERPNLFDVRPCRYALRMNGAPKISSAGRDGAWLAELRSTLALAWPLILANLTCC